MLDLKLYPPPPREVNVAVMDRVVAVDSKIGGKVLICLLIIALAHTPLTSTIFGGISHLERRKRYLEQQDMSFCLQQGVKKIARGRAQTRNMPAQFLRSMSSGNTS